MRARRPVPSAGCSRVAGCTRAVRSKAQTSARERAKSTYSRDRSCAIAVLCVAVLAFASCGDGAGGPPASPASGPPTAAPRPTRVSRPSRSLARPPPTVRPAAPQGTPVVYLLGGSSARECVVGNAAWSAEMKELGAGAVEAMDLGATNRSFSQDMALRARDGPFAADRRAHRREPGPLHVRAVTVARRTSPSRRRSRRASTARST